MSSILGAQTKSSTLISKGRESIIYGNYSNHFPIEWDFIKRNINFQIGAYQFYEEDFGTTDKKSRNMFISGLCKNGI